MPPDYPRRIVFQNTCRKRLKRKVQENRQKSGANPSTATKYPHSATSPGKRLEWTRSLPLSPGGGLKSLPYSGESRRHCNARAHKLCLQYNIYTNGSASGGTIKGGTGVVVTSGNTMQPTIVANLQQRGATTTCSYNEELRAMQMAVDWSNKNVSEDSSVTVFTDSQSLCIALKGTSPAVDGLRRAISTAKSQITIQWVHGHFSVPGNELSNAAA